MAKFFEERRKRKQYQKDIEEFIASVAGKKMNPPLDYFDEAIKKCDYLIKGSKLHETDHYFNGSQLYMWRAQNYINQGDTSARQLFIIQDITQGFQYIHHYFDLRYKYSPGVREELKEDLRNYIPVIQNLVDYISKYEPDNVENTVTKNKAYEIGMRFIVKISS